MEHDRTSIPSSSLTFGVCAFEMTAHTLDCNTRSIGLPMSRELQRFALIVLPVFVGLSAVMVSMHGASLRDVLGIGILCLVVGAGFAIASRR